MVPLFKVLDMGYVKHNKCVTDRLNLFDEERTDVLAVEERPVAGVNEVSRLAAAPGLLSPYAVPKHRMRYSHANIRRFSTGRSDVSRRAAVTPSVW